VKKTCYRWTCWGMMILVGGMVACTGQSKTISLVSKNAAPQQPACIHGRVVNEQGNGFGGVQVETAPLTAVVVTDQFGNFEICHRRVVIDQEEGRTAQQPLLHASYVLKLRQEGYHHLPMVVKYAGAPLQLPQPIRLVLRNVKLPDVQIVEHKDDAVEVGVKGPNEE